MNARAGRRPRERAPVVIEPGSRITALAAVATPGLVALRVGRVRVATLTADDADRLRVHVGDLWTDELAVRVALAAARADCHALALRIASARSITSAALRRRLQQRGHTAAHADASVTRLIAAGVLDDARFAEQFVRAQLAGPPLGKARLLAKLAQKGVPSDLARAAVARLTADRDSSADAFEFARRRAARLPAKLDAPARQRRLYGALARRGFDPEQCRSAVIAALGSRRGGSI